MIEQFLPIVVAESNASIINKIMMFSIIIIILLAAVKNIHNPVAQQCIKIKDIELSNQTNVEYDANKLNLNDPLSNTLLNNKFDSSEKQIQIKENLMTGDIVNMNYIDRKREYKDIIGKYIEIRNNNRKEIPLNKVIVMNDDRKLIPLMNFTTQQTKSGVIYTYILPEIQKIRQIILDISIYNRFIDNVQTSQVAVLDTSKKTIWNYNHIINKDRRYHYINISDPKIVYDRPSNLLCTNTDEDCMQEKQLVVSLAENVWQ
jgi:hypothetical protein